MRPGELSPRTLRGSIFRMYHSLPTLTRPFLHIYRRLNILIGSNRSTDFFCSYLYICRKTEFISRSAALSLIISGFGYYVRKS